MTMSAWYCYFCWHLFQAGTFSLMSWNFQLMMEYVDEEPSRSVPRTGCNEPGHKRWRMVGFNLYLVEAFVEAVLGFNHVRFSPCPPLSWHLIISLLVSGSDYRVLFYLLNNPVYSLDSAPTWRPIAGVFVSLLGKPLGSFFFFLEICSVQCEIIVQGGNDCFWWPHYGNDITIRLSCQIHQLIRVPDYNIVNIHQLPLLLIPIGKSY